MHIRLEVDVKVVRERLGSGHLALCLRVSTRAEAPLTQTVEEEAGAY